MIVLALASLCGLITVQAYWFVRAYQLEEKQLDTTINLALRNVTDQLLKSERDSTSQIGIVEKVASNAYQVHYSHPIDYATLDATVREAFLRHGLLSPFELVVLEEVTGKIAFGNFYSAGVKSSPAAVCLERALPQHASITFVVTFPAKKKEILGSMNLWIFSAVAFVVVLIGFSYMIFDLTKQKKLATLKSDFINNMTHELQTPISNIAVASEVLSKNRGRLSEEKLVHYAEIIASENQRLKVHVEQVLQTAMLEKGELALKKSEVNVNGIIEEVVRTFKLRVQGRGGHLNTNLQALKPVMMGDAFHLKNIFYSLLDNADKYSTHAPEITVSTSNTENGICIAIADKGIGINPEAQPHIFDKFYRASSGNVHDVKGFGLGLTYVRDIVNAHQGKVWVASVPDKGSCFEVYFQNY